MTDQAATLAARLRLAREQAGLSQGQVAKMMQMHRPSISEIEAGRRRVQAEELAEFAKHYHVSTPWLLGQEDGAESPREAKLRLAARELAKLNPEDFDRVMTLFASLGRDGSDGKGKKR
jgi:transcriptional regulator with XRE-family HTH domain